MPIKLGVVMDPLTSIKIKTDSSLTMLLEAQRRQWPTFFMEQKDLFIKDGAPMAMMHPIELDMQRSPWYTLKESKLSALEDLDVILMRKDPPFDMEYIYTTYILDLAKTRGALVVNDPQSLRDANEKLFTAFFPQCCPPSLVSRDINKLKAFLKEYQDVVFKPLDSKGGRSIFLVRNSDPNINVILETLTDFGSRFMMAQKFIPDIDKGDKRILLIDGEAIPYGLSRIPAKGDIRGNLAAGGTGVPTEINAREKWICEQIGPTLKERGLIFVGIDVIGDYLTEINVTSPTCIIELEEAFNINITAKLMDTIEARCNGRKC